MHSLEVIMIKSIAQTPPVYDQNRVIERPDGFYWQDRISEETYGPFTTLMEAVQDMQYQDVTELEEESLEDAEAELGIADWTDPETGELAEGLHPQLRDE